MRLKLLISLIFVLTAGMLLFVYLLPINQLSFIQKSSNPSFNLVNGSEEMQFYPNLRFSSSEISYRIFGCPLQKENDMQYAFEIVHNLTSLTFNPVANNEEIYVTCEDRNRYDNGMFIAGEGGPVNISISGNFNVISRGEILLIKASECQQPNVAVHELFHVLGFKHSANPDNIMHNITKCNQEISADMLSLLNRLYVISSYPDLSLENVSASMEGRFASINFTIMNNGLADAEESKLEIYANDEFVKEFDLDSFKVGQGKFVSISNLFISKLNVKEIILTIKSDFTELNKDNNKATLEIMQ